MQLVVILSLSVYKEITIKYKIWTESYNHETSMKLLVLTGLCGVYDGSMQDDLVLRNHKMYNNSGSKYLQDFTSDWRFVFIKCFVLKH